jgi:hypothetical protein
MVEIISNISHNYWVIITNVTESQEKRENTLSTKFFESHFVLLYYVFCTSIKNIFVHQNDLVILKLIFFLNSVQGAR